MFLPYKVVLERRIMLLAIFPAALLIIGTLGYRWIEGWDWLDSAYMTVITLTTVGYREVHPYLFSGFVQHPVHYWAPFFPRISWWHTIVTCCFPSGLPV